MTRLLWTLQQWWESLRTQSLISSRSWVTKQTQASTKGLEASQRAIGLHSTLEGKEAWLGWLRQQWGRCTHQQNIKDKAIRLSSCFTTLALHTNPLISGWPPREGLPPLVNPSLECSPKLAQRSVF